MSEARAPETPLAQGEHLIATYPASLRAFLMRAALTGAVTGLSFAALAVALGAWSPLLPMWQFMGLVLVFALVSVLLFDGPSRWMRHKGQRWHLTDRRLIFEDDRAPERNAALPLSTISRVTPQFFWRLRIRLTDGTAILMPFLEDPETIRSQIDAARGGTGRRA